MILPATPRNQYSRANIERALAMGGAGAPWAEVAEAIGCPSLAVQTLWARWATQRDHANRAAALKGGELGHPGYIGHSLNWSDYHIRAILDRLTAGGKLSAEMAQFNVSNKAIRALWVLNASLEQKQTRAAALAREAKPKQQYPHHSRMLDVPIGADRPAVPLPLGEFPSEVSFEDDPRARDGGYIRLYRPMLHSGCGSTSLAGIITTGGVG